MYFPPPTPRLAEVAMPANSSCHLLRATMAAAAITLSLAALPSAMATGTDHADVVFAAAKDRDLPAHMARLNRREDVVDIIDSREMLGQYQAIYDQITVFLLGIGGISLLVAAVNILNVMYIAVTERVSEIGVMRSIGVRRREVLRIFLYEALALGVAGSIAGDHGRERVPDRPFSCRPVRRFFQVKKA